MLKKCFLAFAHCFLLIPFASYAQQIKPITKSILIEYGYESVADDDVLGQQMFAKTRYSVYGDESFLVIKKYADNPTPKSMDALTVEIVKDLKTGKVFSCIDVAGQKFREEETEGSDIASAIFGPYADPSFTMTKTADPILSVQGVSCEKWQITQDGEALLSLYLTQTFEPNEVLKNLPMFVNRDSKPLGLCLGHDMAMGNTYKLRASKIEVDQPQKIAEHLTTFKMAGKDEINNAIKAFLGF